MAWHANYPAPGGGSRRELGGRVGGESAAVGFEAGDDALVAGGLGGPSIRAGVTSTSRSPSSSSRRRSSPAAIAAVTSSSRTITA